jgi:diguanylate cyclase (GGDEF)-like protein
VRAISYAYASLFIGSFLWPLHAPAWLWALLGLNLFVYPHLMYWRALRSQNSQKAELQNLVVDAAIWGALCAVLGFPLWISYTLFITSAVNNAFSRGLPGLRDALLAYMAGAMTVWLVVEPRWAMPESPWVVGLCIVGISTYLFSIARIAHLRTNLLRQTRKALERNASEWQAQANQDPLTGLFNRRYFSDTLGRELARAKRDGLPVCLMVLDIDHFKQINDQYGHDMGDRAIQLIGQLLQQSVRLEDVVSRMGGEEFCVLFPGMTLLTAKARAELLRQRLAEQSIDTPTGPMHITASIGLAEYPRDAADGVGLLNAADQALYAAKRNGRNRVERYSSMA